MFCWGSGDYCLIRLGESKRHVLVLIYVVCLQMVCLRLGKQQYFFFQEATSSWSVVPISITHFANGQTCIPEYTHFWYLFHKCFHIAVTARTRRRQYCVGATLAQASVSEAVPKWIKLFDCGVKSLTCPSRHQQIDWTDKKNKNRWAWTKTKVKFVSGGEISGIFVLTGKLRWNATR